MKTLHNVSEILAGNQKNPVAADVSPEAHLSIRAHDEVDRAVCLDEGFRKTNPRAVGINPRHRIGGMTRVRVRQRPTDVLRGVAEAEPLLLSLHVPVHRKIQRDVPPRGV